MYGRLPGTKSDCNNEVAVRRGSTVYSELNSKSCDYLFKSDQLFRATPKFSVFNESINHYKVVAAMLGQSTIATDATKIT